MPIKRNLDSLIASSTVNTNVNGQQANTNFDIEGLFKPTYDKNGCFEITLRFLPPVASEDMQYIENRAHWLKQVSGKSIAIDCLKRWKAPGSNKGNPCPICDYNSKMFDKYGQIKGEYAKHKLASARPEYMCNVLIVRNDNAPTTEGQVFRFKYSKLIKDMLDKAVNGTGETDENGDVIPGINPYSYWGPQDADVISGEVRAGANFVWKAKPGEYGPNYEDSHFNKPSRIAKCVDGVNSMGQPCKKFQPLTDAEIDVIESQVYTLKEHETKQESARSYNDTIKYVKDKCGIDLGLTLGVKTESIESEYLKTAVAQTVNTVEVDDDEMFAGTPLETKKPAAPAVQFANFDEPTPAPKPAPAPAPKPAAQPVVAEDEDDFFARLGQSQE